ncbi:hypothetical protein KFE25_001838 [Diacronema lutheri]|uniref:Calpain catalytic domain-containing protein n=2 Tax=Diacronema lutheri TaxID=2081491 RepID=A0A8J5XHC2_DIALT|nr:hypothetical protein KFE25_001838 [Diacronema lutheri]
MKTDAELSEETFKALAAQHPRSRHANPESTGCAIEGAWTKGLAGGCPKFGSWAKNPQFHLLPSRTAQVTIELRQQMGDDGKGFGIGFVVLKAEDAHAPKLTVTKPEMVFYTKPYKSSQRVSATLTLMPRPAGLPYVVIPSTYEPNQFAQFSLSIETDDPDCKFGWLGDASRVFAGSRAPVPSAGASGAYAQPDNEVRIASEGKALSKSQEAELERMVADAIAWCTANGDKPYEDAEFPADSRSLWGGATNKAGLPDAKVWLRPSQLPAVKEAGERAALFKPRAEIDGVVKGSTALRNDWLLSACNIVAGQKEAIDRVFLFPKNPATRPPAEGARDRGLYVVAFFEDDPHSDDDWKLVLVDDRIPCDGDGRPLFARCVSAHVFWVQIVEKAFAKLSGGYAHMAGGTVLQGLELLTGGTPKKLDLRDADTLETLTEGASRAPGVDLADEATRAALLREHGALWHELLSALKASPPQVVGCVFRAKPKPGKLAAAADDGARLVRAGLEPETVYCVTGGINYDGTRLMRLRQLHGATGEWNGRWSDGSALWTPNMRQMLNYSDDASDGVFWMEYDDFVAHFNKLFFCRMAGDLYTTMTVRSRWHGATAGGGPRHVSFRTNGQWLLDISKRTTVTVTLAVEDPRRREGSGGKDALGVKIGWSIFRGNARPADRRRRRLHGGPAELVAAAEPRLARKVVRTLQLEPSAIPYVLVPHTDEPAREAAFRLVLTADDREDDGLPDLRVEPVRAATDWKTTTLRASWGGASAAAAGPPGSGAQYWANPQYELLVEKQSRVFIFLEPDRAPNADGTPSSHFPPVGFELLEGVGPFCKLHEQASGKRLDQSKVEAGAGVWLEKTLDATGAKPYVVIPFVAARAAHGEHAQAFTITVYTDQKHSFAPVGVRPECPICERMAIVLKRLAEHEAQVDERLEHLEKHRYLLERACRPCGMPAGGAERA